jgi:sigma-B regulation protein RsbU (phosphoserine phosphatase)
MVAGELANIMCGSVFLFIGATACAFAAIRRREQVRLFFWIGLWSGLFGVRLLLESPACVAVLPRSVQAHVSVILMTITYFVLPVATLAWLELALGKVRLFLQTVIAVSLIIAASGSVVYAITRSNDPLLFYHHVVSIVALLVLVVVVIVPRLSRKYLVLPNRAVVVAGTLAFALEALYYNVASALHYRTPLISGALALAVLLFSLGYVAVQIALSGERRLQAIENELSIAREIQASILPADNPQILNLVVAAAYRPMTAVAGDFYDFIFVDPCRTGILLADVTGHGVPAALIAAMIKVALQSVQHCACEPAELLRNLNRILSPQLHAQLVSAAYLFLDTEKQLARYAAAGHPPLLHCRDGILQRLDNNGMLLGVFPDVDYPVRDLPIESGDRFVLYTDGVIEPENAQGHSFGDSRLDQVVHANRVRPPVELVSQLLTELRQWQPRAAHQHDDITLIVIDVR